MIAGQKRAVVACAGCRQRKRRCDGLSPQCTACREKGQECTYEEPLRNRIAQRLHNGDPPVPETGTSELQQRIESIERLLGEHADAIKALQKEKQQQQWHQEAEGVHLSSTNQSGLSLVPTPAPDLYSDRPDHGDKLSPASRTPMPHSTWALTTQSNSGESRPGVNGDDIPPITIPMGHQTSPSSLLALPQMRSLVGDYPEEFIFRVEDSRDRSIALDFMAAPSEGEDWPTDRSVADGYLDSFLSVVDPCHPLFDRDDLLASYEDVMSQDSHSDILSGLFLAIFALGATAPAPPSRVGTHYPGDMYMQKALKILIASWTMSFSGDIQLSQGLILSALYFTYVVEPLTAWKLIYMASSGIQQLLIRCKENLSSQSEIQELTRLSWVCFIIECDLIADFHQPRSGIDVLVDQMPFPNYGTNPKLEHLYALAEISVRSLLNRMHHAIYFTDSLTIYAGRALDSLKSRSIPSPPHPETSLMRVCSELNFQLETWYEGLPVDIKPDLFVRTPGNRQACLLRLRYWSAKQSIFRPFVIWATSSHFDDGEIEIPSTVLTQCKVCLAACRAFINGAEYLLIERTSYTSSVTQFCLSCFLALALAANSPVLGHLASDIADMHRDFVEILKPWARPGSSVECSLEIANSVARKLRLSDKRKR